MDNKKKLLWSILLGFIPVVYTLFLFLNGSLDSMEDGIIDKKFNLVNPGKQISDKIIIVDIDEYSLGKFGNNEKYGRWPWKRNVYPEILTYIALGGPKMILFDIMFPGESPEDDDFAMVNEQIPFISHAVSFMKEETDVQKEEVNAMLRKKAIQVEDIGNTIEKYRKVIPPVGNIGYKAPHLHSVTYKSDPDGIARKYKYLINYEDKYYPSLALKAIDALKPIKSYSHSKDKLVLKHENGETTVIPQHDSKYRLYYYPKNEIYDPYSLKKISIGWIIESLRDLEEGRITSYDDQKIHPKEYRDKIIIPKKLQGRLQIPAELKGVTLIAEDLEGKILMPPMFNGKIILPEKYLRYVNIPKNDKELRDAVFVPEDIISPETFKDKIVLIGTSAAATYDTKTIPYGQIPGVVIHAVAISNAIKKDFIHMISPWVTFFVVIVMTFISAVLLVTSKTILNRILMPFTFIVGYNLISFFLFKYNMNLNLSIFSISYPVTFAVFLGYMILIEGAEKRKYSKILGNMVDPTIVSEALNDLETLKKGGEMEITAFFSDVASFSTISEQLSSEDLAALLNEYLSAMTIILKDNRGTLDKYIGDAVVGIFGAPIATQSHFLDAAKATLQMLEKLEDLKKYWQANNLYCKDAQNMNIRVGLNTGLAKVGFMGTDTLASYTMMGDTVNLAARLEAAGKDYGVSTLVSSMTQEKIKDQILTRELDAVVVKGKTLPVHIFEIVGIRGQVPDNLVQATAFYEEGFQLYLNREWDKAIKKFKESSQVKGKKDKSAEMLIERCELYIADPPPENWNGAFVRTHK